MTKEELINALTAIPGNPKVLSPHARWYDEIKGVHVTKALFDGDDYWATTTQPVGNLTCVDVILLAPSAMEKE